MSLIVRYTLLDINKMTTGNVRHWWRDGKKIVADESNNKNLSSVVMQMRFGETLHDNDDNHFGDNNDNDCTSLARSTSHSSLDGSNSPSDDIGKSVDTEGVVQGLLYPGVDSSGAAVTPPEVDSLVGGKRESGKSRNRKKSKKVKNPITIMLKVAAELLNTLVIHRAMTLASLLILRWLRDHCIQMMEQ